METMGIEVLSHCGVEIQWACNIAQSDTGRKILIFENDTTEIGIVYTDRRASIMVPLLNPSRLCKVIDSFGS
jgi:hypothetical protein